MLRFLGVVGCWLVVVGGVVAQEVALRELHRVLPASGSGPFAVCDVDLDGFDDVVAGSGSVWLGSAGGTFELLGEAMPRPTGFVRALVLADLDGDGLPDCVRVNDGTNAQTRADTVSLNVGGGRFVAPAVSTLPGSGVPSTSVAAADIDGDGDVDLAVGRVSQGTIPGLGTQGCVVYRNDGTGTFTFDPGALPLQAYSTNGLAFFDVDGDGDADLYCANEPSPFGSSDRLYLNDGTGQFTTSPSFFQSGRTHDVQAHDFDADGDVDLLLRDQAALRYLENTGAGLVAASAPPSPGPADQVLVGDWNADGLVDYAVRVVGTVHCFVAVAPGVFQPSALPTVSSAPRETIALDWDRDGDGDLIAPRADTSIAGVSYDSWLLRNVGTAWRVLPAATLPRIPVGTSPVERLADLDGDGTLDVIWSPYTTHAGIVHFGNLLGGFETRAIGDFGAPASRAQVRDMAIGDLDGDGDLDVVCVHDPEPGQTTSPSTIYLQNGNNLQATASTLPFGRNVVLADFDGDGDLDVFVEGWAQDMVLRNDGGGNLTPIAGAVPVTGFSLDGRPTAADFDGDGDLDLAGFGDGLLVNDGTGRFTQQPVPGITLGDVVVADFDGDGDPDLFVVDGAPFGEHALLQNDGAGNFTIVPVTATAASHLAQFFAVDIDADGLADIVRFEGCGSACGHPPSAVLRNDQGIGFVEVAHSIGESIFTILRPSFGDLDGDGDIDMIARHPDRTAIYDNLRQQLAWRSLPRIGRPLEFDLFGPGGQAYALALAAAPTFQAIPGLGRLRLDPASLLVVQVGAFDADGRASFGAPVPNLPPLVGVRLYLQALTAFPSATSPLRLGNLESVVFQAR